MRLAAIDVGTNTILMLVADIEKDGSLNAIKDEHTIARLGKGVDEHGIIQQDTFLRVRDILLQLKSIAEADHVQHFVVYGTSALRDAVNSQDIIDFIKQESSLDIRIISGLEEAELTYVGAVSEYLPDYPSGDYAVVDIGGGSTELVIGTGSKITSTVSIDIGSVRLTERILKKSPPDNIAIDNAVQFIKEHLQNVPLLPPTFKIIGVAGTLTTLAALDLRIIDYDKNLINHHALKIESIERIYQDLRFCTLDQLRNYPQIHPLRADILIAGILILREILIKMNFRQITVSDRGLRYGMLIKTAQRLVSSSI